MCGLLLYKIKSITIIKVFQEIFDESNRKYGQIKAVSFTIDQ